MKKKKSIHVTYSEIINIVLLVLWMVFIFAMSSFDAPQSDGQSGLIVNIVNNVIHTSNIDLLTTIIRKLAHLTEYFILGLLMINCLKDYKINKIYILSVVFSFIYAITDELHQTFISGRSGEIRDVVIDTIGALIGILIYKYIRKKYEKNI